MIKLTDKKVILDSDFKGYVLSFDCDDSEKLYFRLAKIDNFHHQILEFGGMCNRYWLTYEEFKGLITNPPKVYRWEYKQFAPIHAQFLNYTFDNMKELKDFDFSLIDSMLLMQELVE